MVFSLRIKRHDLYRNVPAPATKAGRGGMVRLRSGPFGWILQVGHPPTSALGKRRAKTCSRESDPPDIGIPSKKHSRSKAEKHTDPGTGPQLEPGAEGSE